MKGNNVVQGARPRFGRASVETLRDIRPEMPNAVQLRQNDISCYASYCKHNKTLLRSAPAPSSHRHALRDVLPPWARPASGWRQWPAEQVAWLVIPLAFHRHQSRPEVLATLDLALPSVAGQVISKSVVTQARQWLEAAPLEPLFDQTASACCTRGAERHAWKGMALWAMNGSITFRAPDSADNRPNFRGQS